MSATSLAMPTVTSADPWDGYAFNKPKMDEKLRWELTELFVALLGIAVVMIAIGLCFFAWRLRVNKRALKMRQDREHGEAQQIHHIVEKGFIARNPGETSRRERQYPFQVRESNRLPPYPVAAWVSDNKVRQDAPLPARRGKKYPKNPYAKSNARAWRHERDKNLEEDVYVEGLRIG